jgi:uncharacterized protein (DUF2147 family)
LTIPRERKRRWWASGKRRANCTGESKLIDPDPKDPDPRCDRCEGELKGKPLIGLHILWDLRKDGDAWSGGRILDPDNGKVYKCHIAMEQDGKKLKVRGFIGLSLLGRTQYWLRQE